MRGSKELLLAVAAMAVLVVQLPETGKVEAAVTVQLNGLKLHFYNNSCKNVEAYVKHLVTKAWNADKSITPALLRLLYSDCLVTGCDGSILLDGKKSEKTAPQNSRLRGFGLIDGIKRVLEVRCPGIVSCADILNLATRDAAGLAGAPKYPVFTGRRDTTKPSTAATVDLPSPSITWNQALAYFEAHDLDVLDLGTLLGAHTMGKTQCKYVRDRLYNFNNTGRPDPSIDRKLAKTLRRSCPRRPKPKQPDNTVFLNPGRTAATYNFTNSFYNRVMANKTVFFIDQQFTTNRDGFRIASEFKQGFEDFRKSFALSMARLGSLKVLTGNQGEIRKNCRVINA